MRLPLYLMGVFNMKTCSKCNLEKPLTEYYLIKNKGRAYHRSYCKKCDNEISRSYTKNNPDIIKIGVRRRYEKNRANPEWVAKLREYYIKNRERKKEYKKIAKIKNPRINRKTDLMFKYKMTLEQYDNIILLQGNKCKICGIEFSDKIRANVDHCHKIGKVRGVLCSACNTSLGLLRENTKTLKSMIKYIEKSLPMQIKIPLNI